ncbi:MAG: hypothetical protein HZB91_11620 [Elusimicrobia bacterium]|nr:hypothetical protein [Elusimicrobiota bacterium]
MEYHDTQQATITDPGLVERVARIEAAVVDSCRQIEDQHLAAASLRERLHQVDSTLHASGNRLETILDSPAALSQPEPVVIPPPEPLPAPAPTPAPAAKPAHPAPTAAVHAATAAREDDHVPPFLLPYLALLAVGAVLPWLGVWLPGWAASAPSASGPMPEAAALPSPGARVLKEAAQAPLPLPDDSRERALRLVYSFSPPGRKETVFDLLLRSAPPALREEVDRVDQDCYLVTLSGVRLSPGDGPARFEANLAEGTVSVVE